VFCLNSYGRQHCKQWVKQPIEVSEVREVKETEGMDGEADNLIFVVIGRKFLFVQLGNCFE
jgi:hypothetical protein